MKVNDINKEWFDEQIVSESLDYDLCHDILQTLADAGKISDALSGCKKLLDSYVEL